MEALSPSSSTVALPSVGSFTRDDLGAGKGGARFDVPLMRTYLESLLPVLLDADLGALDNSMFRPVKAASTGWKDTVTAFASDPNVNVLYVDKVRNANVSGADSNEDLYSYFLVTEPTYSPRHVASIALLKRVQILDSSAPLQQQLNIISLPGPATGAATAQDADGAVNGNGVSARDVDGEGEVRSLVRQSPYEALHSVVHNVMAPWFDAYVSSKESRDKDAVVVAKKKDADSKLGIPMARRKFAE
ncbi:hypothetical protein CF326_g6607, partial [Tilletia indica]